MWCVVANVKPEAFGHGANTGTRHFAAGAKLWCLPAAWGDGYERIRVIGRHRGSPRHVVMVQRASRLTNWRARVAYHPEVLRLLTAYGGWRDEEHCVVTARYWAREHPPIADVRAAAARVRRALALLDGARGRPLERAATGAQAARSHEERLRGLVTPEILVLADWLEEEGCGLDLDQLVAMLERRARHLAGT